MMFYRVLTLYTIMFSDKIVCLTNFFIIGNRNKFMIFIFTPIKGKTSRSSMKCMVITFYYLSIDSI